MDKKRFKENLFLVSFGIILFMLVTNIGSLYEYFITIVDIITPFIIGFVIAYILNRPLMFFKNNIFNFIEEKMAKKGKKLSNLLSIVSVYFFFFLILSLLISFIIPQIIESIKILANDIPTYTEKLQEFYTFIVDKYGIEKSDVLKLVIDTWNEISNKFFSIISNILPQIVSVTVSLTGAITNFIIGFIISVYMLASKDFLLDKSKKMFYAFTPKKHSENLMDIFSKTNQTFCKFITGQLTDAFIVGILCFIGMSVLKIPFSVLVSTIIAFTNIIPIFGPIIGMVPTVLIILMVDPSKAIIFIIFVIILQQIDGNFIYPKVVGDSIGLPGIFVIFAIILGGGLFGIIGMILGVPIFAVFYYILSNIVKYKIKKNNSDKQDIMLKIKK
ncbi:MAG: AI-2E family transporter [Oscillospiraceae bacterium]|nr:AI-2E family transporter [Oscillospiraceae bacterium]